MGEEALELTRDQLAELKKRFFREMEPKEESCVRISADRMEAWMYLAEPGGDKEGYSKEELIGMSDIVMLCLAVTPETAGMVDHDFLAAMKPGAFLINTARGDLVDNAALQDALENGTLGGAGLDTLFPEPVLADHPLLHMAPAAMEKVIFSPHIGGITVGSFTRAHRLIWENLWRLSRGERPLYVTNG